MLCNGSKGVMLKGWPLSNVSAGAGELRRQSRNCIKQTNLPNFNFSLDITELLQFSARFCGTILLHPLTPREKVF